METFGRRLFCVMDVMTGIKRYEGPSAGTVVARLDKPGTCYGWGPNKASAHLNCEERRKQFIASGYTGAPLVPKFPMPERAK